MTQPEIQTPLDICLKGREVALKKGHDLILIDTAGRLHIDESLMMELREMKGQIKPKEVLLVADAMTGQDAVRSAKEFHDRLGLTGVILTKMDGDARGARPAPRLCYTKGGPDPMTPCSRSHHPWGFVRRIVGLALSPEYIYPIRPGELMPDEARFGLFWMERRALGSAFQMEGAFNDVVSGNFAYNNSLREFSMAATAATRINNMTFSDNSGWNDSQYGIYMDYVENSTFTNNTAASDGGGFYTYNSNPTLTNCTFTANSATSGGGISNYSSSSPTLTNCTFTANAATFGGGMCNSSSSSSRCIRLVPSSGSASGVRAMRALLAR